MVRRWSCIITLNKINPLTKTFKKIHKISIFKSSVNFKKFSHKFTKFKRKSLIRFKHKTNWLPYTSVFKFWVKDYIFNKNYARYQFFNKIFINNVVFFNFNLIKKLTNFSFNFNFIFYVFLNKNYKYFYKSKIKNISNSALSVGFYPLNINLPISVAPTYRSFDNSFFPFSLNVTHHSFEFTNLFDFIYSLHISKLVEFRRALCILFYFKIFNVK